MLLVMDSLSTESVSFATYAVLLESGERSTHFEMPSLKYLVLCQRKLRKKFKFYFLRIEG